MTAAHSFSQKNGGCPGNDDAEEDDLRGSKRCETARPTCGEKPNKPGEEKTALQDDDHDKRKSRSPRGAQA
jgi:hypothetical protein